MRKVNKKLLKENLNNANIQTYGDQVFNKLLTERIKLLVERAPIDKLMDVTAEIARYELEDFLGTSIEYNLNSLPVIDAFLDKHREFLQKTEANSLLVGVWFGAFLGKVLVKELNGKWQNVPEQASLIDFQFGKVKFDNNMFASPTVTILKSIDDDSYRVEDVVSSLQVLARAKLPTGDINSKNLNP